MMNVIEYFNNMKRALSQKERNDLIDFFPNAKSNRIKFLDDHMMKLNSSENLCIKKSEDKASHKHLFECMSQTKTVQVYLSNSGQYLESITNDEIVKDVCSMSKYKCVDSYSFGVRYNCIGLAIGVIRWVDTTDINTYIKHGYSPEQAITEFINTQYVEFPPYYSTNLFKVLHQLKYVNDIQAIPQNNTIAFYFKDGKCEHAARYITNMESWASKLGEWIVISHSLEDLMGDNYGNTIYYMEVSGSSESIFNDN